MSPTQSELPPACPVSPQSRMTLNTGHRIPLMGLGTWPLRGKAAEEAVFHALRTGYRLIDTARMYGNEEAVGAGIARAEKAGIAAREEVFVTSKLMPSGYGEAARAVEDSLRRLRCGYIDLMLVHQQGPGDTEAYRALVRAQEKGLVRSAGVSNFYALRDVERVCGPAGVFPAAVQNENHLYFQGGALRRELRARGAALESWYPLGGGGNTARMFSERAVLACARRHGRTPAQVILRWHLQSGFIALPGSGDPAHIEENFGAFGFALTDGEMRQLASLDQQRRFENW